VSYPWDNLITIDLANAIFVFCVAVGGILLLITVLLDDVLGGLLDFLHLGFDLGGVTLMPLLLGFVSMFGVGGLFGTQLFNLGAGPASLVGLVFGLIGAGIVWAVFGVLRRAEAPSAFSLADLIGQRGRVTVSISAGKPGSVLLSYAGGTHDVSATSDRDIPVGSVVLVTDVAGSTMVVTLANQPASEGGASHA
jgi:membrane protein implicated in regulation of membrane protease activity